ncbi:DUF4255 domain-containing protein [Tropicimonas sp. IMCC34043]|uniref:DUF4255 domain-containing protein n=1 Tax=Tropicimonas sp. IMCC34043 TaxID=2248760 RepID=UPI000E282820|nr:DUF4255 domain-containing protein [Tropicimonas sp. IMCC34043]
MADYHAIGRVTASIRRLLQDRMVSGAAVTAAPPDQTVAGFDGARVNLYLFQVLENASLKNDHGPNRGHPASYGRPPLSLNLRYMMTSHADSEVQPDSDITAQEILGDAMRVLHIFGNRMDTLTLINLAPPALNEPVLDPELSQEYERLKITLHPVSMEDVTKIWSALSEENFRRTVVYEVTVVQIDQTEPTRIAPPVEERRILAVAGRHRPVIERVFVTPPPGQPEAETRVAIGEEITIVATGTAADRLYVQFGRLAPIRVPPSPDGRIRLTLPDAVLPVDYDPVVNQPIPAEARLQPGTLQIRLVGEIDVEGVAGALGRGTGINQPMRVRSNVALMQLVPQVTGVAPGAGNAGTVLTVTGTRLWHPGSTEALVAIGGGTVAIRAPETPGDWANPTPTAVEVPVAEAGLAPLAPADPAYPVAVIVDGARSRASGLGFHLDP